MQVFMWKETGLLSARWILSSLLVLAIVKYFNCTEGFFALVTIAAIVRLTPSDTCIRSVMRLLGTMLGALLIYALLSIAGSNTVALIIGCLIISFIAGYIIFQSSVLSYVGVMIGVTMVNILALMQLVSSGSAAVDYRLLFVAIGIGAMCIVDALFCYFTRAPLFSREIARDLWKECCRLTQKQQEKAHIIAALQLCIAVAITLVPWLVFQYHGGFWAVVSCFFVVEESLSLTTSKGNRRFLAHLIAAMVGISIVAISIYWPVARIPLLILSIVMISCFMVHKKEIAIVGNTMGIAIIIMVVGGDNENVIYRFAYTVMGILVALIICAVFAKKWHFAESENA